MKSKENKTLNYIIGEHPEVNNRIVIAFDDTGLDLNNPEHKHFVDTFAKVMISQMYAKANNIPMEDVKY
mgnify:CR=1 FL=1